MNFSSNADLDMGDMNWNQVLTLYPSVEASNGEIADLIYGSNEAFERAWTLHALVSPGYLTSDLEPHFRRIGASRCFALSFDLQPQSRALAAASDFDPRRSHAEDLEDEELEVIYEADRLTEIKELKMEGLRDVLPVHHASLTLTDEELRAFFVIHADDTMGWD
ncbi:hypothetical protein N7532_009433 [Penicillium argentinense]|uniref:Uncharacterized protein n=1 Tax=Penicillium argentinense TaxID=1131581 RepID=A0A9W9K2I2_9EURO|nr:uncharacterized protein N7532_009433 [Penicillium argentinense]KAJ5090749.1 hypothetical protein N7532_009433 [Penicillium argentinense]